MAPSRVPPTLCLHSGGDLLNLLSHNSPCWRHANVSSRFSRNPFRAPLTPVLWPAPLITSFPWELNSVRYSEELALLKAWLSVLGKSHGRDQFPASSHCSNTHRFQFASSTSALVSQSHVCRAVLPHFCVLSTELCGLLWSLRTDSPWVPQSCLPQSVDCFCVQPFVTKPLHFLFSRGLHSEIKKKKKKIRIAFASF